ncbi:MAG: AAA family ATPase [bacterium]|nr:AAA family ATPase [bacterium]
MKLAKTLFSCTKCGAQTPKWSGRCVECGGWGTLSEEQRTENREQSRIAAKPAEVLSLADIETKNTVRISSGIGEVDRVLGGGIPPGAVILLAGEPGIGKSTLVAQIASQIASSVKRQASNVNGQMSSVNGQMSNVKGQGSNVNGQMSNVLYVSGEESPSQLKDRFSRLAITNPSLAITSDTVAERIAASMENIRPALVIIDSVQTLDALAAEDGGAVTKLRAATALLAAAAKTTNTALLLVGQVTKEMDIAGPKTLEHLVDIVLTFEGDRYGAYRMLRAAKNRFGATDELGVFSMTGAGLIEVPNPSAEFLTNRSSAPGSVIGCTLEGKRPLLIEIQALVHSSRFPYPERRASGFDTNRLNLLIAVLEKHAGVSLGNHDIHVNVTSGIRIKEPAADLAVALAIVSSFKNKVIPPDTVAFGEIGLGGELRSVREPDRRIQEALTLNFKHCLCPSGAKKKSEVVHQFSHISEVLRFLGI